MTNLTRKIILIVALMLVCSCASAKKNTGASGSLTDSRDSKKYKTVKIGELTWLAENLNYNAKDSKCYGDKQEYCSKYGRLYNWETAKTACPSGWHLPTNDDFGFLSGATGGWKEAGKNIRANKGWKAAGASSGDKFGFSALPAGFYSDRRRGFRAEGYEAHWWVASDTEKNRFIYTSHADENYYKYELLSNGIFDRNTIDRAMNTWKRSIAPHQGAIYYGSISNHIDVGKDALLSVRCVKD